MQLPTLQRALLFFSSIVGLAGCAEEMSDATTEAGIGHVASAIQGGATDTIAVHNFAVAVANRFGGVCSGTLIAPNLVMTARHCVIPPSNNELVTCSDIFPANVAASALYVTTEPNLYTATSYYGAIAILTPTDKAFCGNDIALIILAKCVPASEAQPATPVVQFKMTDKRLSSSITAMGYGITNPSAEDSGQRRIRQSIPLLCIPGSMDMECNGDDVALYSDDAAEFVTEGYVCSGDSGSGAFDQRSFDRGSPYVMGTLSRGRQSKDQCLAAIYSRTDAHAQLIIDAAKKAAQQGGYDLPSWASPASASGTTCDGDTCTDGVANEPASAAPSTRTITRWGCSTAPVASAGFGSSSSSSSTALVGLAIAAVFAVRRRKVA